MKNKFDAEEFIQDLSKGVLYNSLERCIHCGETIHLDCHTLAAHKSRIEHFLGVDGIVKIGPSLDKDETYIIEFGHGDASRKSRRLMHSKCVEQWLMHFALEQLDFSDLKEVVRMQCVVTQAVDQTSLLNNGRFIRKAITNSLLQKAIRLIPVADVHNLRIVSNPEPDRAFTGYRFLIDYTPKCELCGNGTVFVRDPIEISIEEMDSGNDLKLSRTIHYRELTVLQFKMGHFAHKTCISNLCNKLLIYNL